VQSEGVDDVDEQARRDARLAFGDVAAQQVEVEVEGAGRLAGRHDAHALQRVVVAEVGDVEVARGAVAQERRPGARQAHQGEDAERARAAEDLPATEDRAEDVVVVHGSLPDVGCLMLRVLLPRPAQPSQTEAVSTTARNPRRLVRARGTGRLLRAVNTVPESPRNIWKVIAASSAGTMIEWYDFYIFGSLATIISGNFFPKENETAALLATLAAFATGFVVRPFGALVFGRIGDLVGRKYAFLVTLLIMGVPTARSGCCRPTTTIGILAPILLLVLRLLQGLALGGEYGGAAIYVAEHAPDHGARFYTRFIQTTADARAVPLARRDRRCRAQLGEDEFRAWGWRMPFLLSVVLVVFSYLIRRKLQESPLFQKMKRRAALDAARCATASATAPTSSSCCSRCSARPRGRR
jgi:hypothetical protein